MCNKYILSLFLLCIFALIANAHSPEYIDLGLPSGTLWKTCNESDTCTYERAVRYYDGFLPTSGQFKELIDNCKWVWMERGYKIIGKNGNSIYLSAEFYKHGHHGAYWSATKVDNNCCYGLLFFENNIKVDRTCNVKKCRSIILCK